MKNYCEAGSEECLLGSSLSKAPEETQLPTAYCPGASLNTLVVILNPEADFSTQRRKSWEGKLLGRRELFDTQIFFFWESRKRDQRAEQAIDADRCK